jgi:predicted enzyme related to lactoylglutathione lyase
MDTRFERGDEDVVSVVALEHVNVTIPDQRLATIFYVTGLGLTRDPYLMTGVTNMWINAGASQFHLPSAAQSQVLRGTIGLVVPDLDELLARLESVASLLTQSKFRFQRNGDCLDITGPWGNRFRCHAPNPAFGRINLGIPYVSFDVPRGTAEGISRFYGSLFNTAATMVDDPEGPYARIAVGVNQYLIFRETLTDIPPYDGHHIQIYVANFSTSLRRLMARGIVTETSSHQYRFQRIIDPENGDDLFLLEHEVRSMHHPLYLRPLVNRNPAQSNVRYSPGRDNWIWTLPGR